MGLATAGLAFKTTAATPPALDMIRRAFGTGYDVAPAAETRHGQDIRVPGQVSAESAQGATFIYDADIAQQILFEGKTPDAALLAALGDPDVLVAFCHFDSGDTFGYAIFERGVQTRLRLYAGATTTDAGTPGAWELPWRDAEAFVEEEGDPPAFRNPITGEIATEGYVTARMLGVTLHTLFGICPWAAWDASADITHYRNGAVAAPAAPASARAWWKFW